MAHRGVPDTLEKRAGPSIRGLRRAMVRWSRRKIEFGVLRTPAGGFCSFLTATTSTTLLSILNKASRTSRRKIGTPACNSSWFFGILMILPSIIHTVSLKLRLIVRGKKSDPALQPQITASIMKKETGALPGLRSSVSCSRLVGRAGSAPWSKTTM